MVKNPKRKRNNYPIPQGHAVFDSLKLMVLFPVLVTYTHYLLKSTRKLPLITERFRILCFGWRRVYLCASSASCAFELLLRFFLDVFFKDASSFAIEIGGLLNKRSVRSFSMFVCMVLSYLHKNIESFE